MRSYYETADAAARRAPQTSEQLISGATSAQDVAAPWRREQSAQLNATADAAGAVTPIRVREFGRLPDLEQLGRLWDNLAEAVGRPSPLSTYAWFISQLEENAQLAGKRWRVFAAFAGERLVGVLALIEEPGVISAFGRRRLRMPGHYYALNSEPLLDDATADLVLLALLNSVERWRPGFPVEFGGVRSDGPAARALAQTRHSLRVTEARGTSIQLQAAPEDWAAALPKNLRRISGDKSSVCPRSTRTCSSV